MFLKFSESTSPVYKSKMSSQSKGRDKSSARKSQYHGTDVIQHRIKENQGPPSKNQAGQQGPSSGPSSGRLPQDPKSPKPEASPPHPLSYAESVRPGHRVSSGSGSKSTTRQRGSDIASRFQVGPIPPYSGGPRLVPITSNTTDPRSEATSSQRSNQSFVTAPSEPPMTRVSISSRSSQSRSSSHADQVSAILSPSRTALIRKA